MEEVVITPKNLRIWDRIYYLILVSNFSFSALYFVAQSDFSVARGYHKSLKANEWDFLCASRKRIWEHELGPKTKLPLVRKYPFLETALSPKFIFHELPLVRISYFTNCPWSEFHISQTAFSPNFKYSNLPFVRKCLLS